MKIWDLPLELASNHHLFLPGEEIILLSDGGGLDRPSLPACSRISDVTLPQNINPSPAQDAHIYHGKWRHPPPPPPPPSVNTPVFPQPSASGIGWCIARWTFSVIARWVISGGKNWQGEAPWMKCFPQAKMALKTWSLLHTFLFPFWLYLGLIKLPAFELYKSIKSIRISCRSYSEEGGGGGEEACRDGENESVHWAENGHRRRTARMEGRRKYVQPLINLIVFMDKECISLLPA